MKRSTDLVPVVRCKYCKWRPLNLEQDVYEEYLVFPHDVCPLSAGDPWYNRRPNPDGYCWMGEYDEVEDKQ